MRKSSTNENGETKKRVQKRVQEDHKNGIQNFFHKAEVNGDRVTPEAAKLPDINDKEDPFQIPKQKPPTRKPRTPKLKVVDPPNFNPVRATSTDAFFPSRLKIREFVLKCSPLLTKLTKVEKIFSRKLHVPAKHIILMADPCEELSSLTTKHLFVALLKIIQSNISEQDEQNKMRETLKRIEKAPAGTEIIFTTAHEWVIQMEGKDVPADDISRTPRLVNRKTQSPQKREYNRR
jgi:hypothetical protein